MKGRCLLYVFFVLTLLSSGALAQEAPITLTDARGVIVVLEKPAERIVSLYSAHTENLFALGVGEHIIGASRTESYPPEALALPTFDYKGDPEAVIAAMPDLVLVRPMIERVAPNYIAALERAGLTVVSLYPETFDDFPAYIRQLALLTGTTAKAEELLTEREAALAALEAESATWPARVNVFFECTNKPLRTLTPDALAAETVRLAGGELIGVADAPPNPGSSMTEYPLESLIEQGAEVALYIAQRGGMNPTVDEQEIAARPGYTAIAAVQRGHVLIVDEKLISSPVFRQAAGAQALQQAMKQWLDETKNGD